MFYKGEGINNGDFCLWAWGQAFRRCLAALYFNANGFACISSSRILTCWKWCFGRDPENILWQCSLCWSWICPECSCKLAATQLRTFLHRLLSVSSLNRTWRILPWFSLPCWSLAAHHLFSSQTSQVCIEIRIRSLPPTQNPSRDFFSPIN